MPETYTAVECAHRMGIRPETLRELIRKKELPFGFSYREKSGRRRYIIPQKAFDNFMEGKSNET